MAVPVVRVVGLAEFRRELRAVGAGWPRELARVHRTLARKAEGWARSEARGLPSAMQRAAAGGIRGRGTARDATLGVSATARAPFARAAIWGAKRQTGWNVANPDAPQFPDWIGNTWDVAGPGGPYAINAALRQHLLQIVDEYGDMVDDLSRRAFPN